MGNQLKASLLLVLWAPPSAAQPYHWAGWEVRDGTELHPERAGPAVPGTSRATLSDLAASLAGTTLSFTSHVCPAWVPNTTAPQQGPERAEVWWLLSNFVCYFKPPSPVVWGDG